MISKDYIGDYIKSFNKIIMERIIRYCVYHRNDTGSPIKQLFSQRLAVSTYAVKFTKITI